MEKKTFTTYIDRKGKFGDNEYVRGRISGIMYAICGRGGKQASAIMLNTDLDILTMKVTCTLKQYVEFMEVIEGLYPGVCVFDLNVVPPKE